LHLCEKERKSRDDLSLDFPTFFLRGDREFLTGGPRHRHYVILRWVPGRRECSCVLFSRFIDYGAIKAPRDVRFLCHCVTKQIRAFTTSEIMEHEGRPFAKYC